MRRLEIAESTMGEDEMVHWDEVKDSEDEDNGNISNRANNVQLVDCCICGDGVGDGGSCESGGGGGDDWVMIDRSMIVIC